MFGVIDGSLDPSSPACSYVGVRRQRKVGVVCFHGDVCEEPSYKNFFSKGRIVVEQIIPYLSNNKKRNIFINNQKRVFRGLE